MPDPVAPAERVRLFGAMDLTFDRREDRVSVVVQVHLATLLVDLTVLAPDAALWKFRAEAANERASGSLLLSIGAPGFYSTIHGDVRYTQEGCDQHYRGLIYHWLSEHVRDVGLPEQLPAPSSEATLPLRAVGSALEAVARPEPEGPA